MSEKQDIVERKINGEKVRWSRSLGGPITEIPPVKDEPEPEPKEPSGVALHPRVDVVEEKPKAAPKVKEPITAD